MKNINDQFAYCVVKYNSVVAITSVLLWTKALENLIHYYNSTR